MSNARNLANLLGTGTTIASAKIADDAITNAKILNDAVTGAKIEDSPTIAGNLAVGGTTSLTTWTPPLGGACFHRGAAKTSMLCKVWSVGNVEIFNLCEVGSPKASSKDWKPMSRSKNNDLYIFYSFEQV